jgi:hypothetical protein
MGADSFHIRPIHELARLGRRYGPATDLVDPNAGLIRHPGCEQRGAEAINLIIETRIDTDCRDFPEAP